MKAEYINLKDINGIGKKLLDTFNKQGLYTAKDLLLSVPYHYDYYYPMNLYEASNTNKACLVGRITTPIKYQYYRSHLSSLIFSISTNEQLVKVIIFNREYLKKVLKPGMSIMVSGKYNKYKKEIMVSEIFPSQVETRIDSKYRIKDVPAKTVLRLVNNALEMGATLTEYLPNYCLDKYNFSEINSMIRGLHNPISLEVINEAKRRKKYEEILEFSLRLNYYKSLKEIEKREPISYDITKVKKLISSIPFELTEDQKDVCNQVFKDFKGIYPANRIIQGDVGSGKTIVALIASYAIVTAKKQVVIMAPTEILARQHFAYFNKFLNSFNVKCALFTSSISKKERTSILNEISNGNIDIVIGTHALFYDEIKYKDLGIAIIDEQHRFGVNARNKLLKNDHPIDAIYLSATPIPRTMALTVFSDLDISTIKTVRKEKKKVYTKALTINCLDEAFKKLENELHLGHQAYFVTSAIEATDSDRFDLDEVSKLLKMNYPEARIECLNGKMKDEMKNSIMERFANKEIDILVSTTVIEVGISVDNATMMVIMDAQNFGLSSLHQLRGRVGRADLEGYCYLITNDLDIERIRLLEESYDGFYLAEQDLKLRGPGDYFGMRQSGISNFVFASYGEDLELFKKVNQDALDLLKNRNKDLTTDKYINKVIEELDFSTSLN